MDTAEEFDLFSIAKLFLRLDSLLKKEAINTFHMTMVDGQDDTDPKYYNIGIRQTNYSHYKYNATITLSSQRRLNEDTRFCICISFSLVELRYLLHIFSITWD